MSTRRQSSQRARIRRFPYAAAAVAIAIGVFDWLVFFLAAPDDVVAVMREMSQVTALLTIFAGIAGLTTIRADQTRAIVIAGRICATIVVVVAGMSVVNEVFGFGVSADRALQSVISSWPAGQPSKQSAVAYAAIGAALLLIGGQGWRRRVADWLALLAAAIATIAALGYLFGVPAFYGAPARGAGHTYMSLPTMVAVLVLAIGSLLTRVEHGIVAVVVAEDAGGVVARRLLGWLLVFPVICIVIVAGTRQYSLPVAASFVLLAVIGPGSVLILSTARRLSVADRALRSSEGRLRLLVDKASDAIFIADLDGRYTDVNEAACRLLQYRRDEIVGKTILDLIPASEVSRLAASKERMRTGAVDVAEWSLRRGDGTFVPVEVSAKIFPDGRWQGIVRDISDRKEAEAKLVKAAASERAMRTDLESVMEAVTASLDEVPRTSVESVLRAIADKARIAVGAAYAAIAIGSDPDRIFDHWVAVGMRDDMERILGRIPRPVGVLGEVLRRGQAIRYADVTKAPAYRGVPAGHPPITSFLATPIEYRDRIVGVLYLANKQHAHEFSPNDADVVAAFANRVAPAIEVAVQYATQQTMRRWLQSIIDQLPEGVIVLDEHGAVKAMNREMLALAREDTSEPDRYGNLRSFDVRTPDRRPVPFDELPLVRALHDGTVTREREYLIRKSDGRMVPIVASAGPLRDALHRIAGAILVVTEISERKEMERLREEWIAVVAHDLRQPLNSILLWSDRVAEEGQGKLAAERIQNAAWRLNRMVQDLLDAARIAATRLEIDPHASDIVAAVRLAIENARDASPDATFELDSSPRALAWFDNDRIQQILANLLSNAVKYGTRGEPIRITVRSDGDVEVAVTSRGPMLPEDQRARLFSRFSRSEGARASGVPGIGLGLYITKGLVEAHGGKIWLESTGTENSFKFTLPGPPER